MANPSSINSLMTFKEIAAAIASRARGRRKALKLSRAELSKRCGVSVPTIARFELTGVTTLAVLIKMAQALGAIDSFEGLFSTPKYKSMEEFVRQEE